MMDEVNVRPDQVIVRGGSAIRYTEFAHRNGCEQKSLQIISAFNGDHFVCTRIDRGEEHTQIGSLESILGQFNPAFGQKYQRLFSLEKPTEADIREIGLDPNLEVVFQ